MSLADWAAKLKRSCVVLQLALRHPRTPWYAKLCGAITLLYALAPIDLIPDFIPVLGHLDDFVLVPLGIWITLKLIPQDVWAECQAEALRLELARPAKDWRGTILIVFLWLLLLGLGFWAVRLLF